MAIRNRQPLWTCPRCRRRFANRNQSHSCGRHDLAHHFQGKDRTIRLLFETVRRAVAACGPVVVLPEKTRIAFQVRMSFAQVTPRQHWLDGHVVLARRRPHPRFRRIDTISPRNHVHHFRLMAPGDVDAEFSSWLREAYAVGAQEHLEPRRAPRQVLRQPRPRRTALDLRGPIGTTDILRVSRGAKRDPAVDRWLTGGPVELRSMAQKWFAQMRQCGDDVREQMHDGCPVACVEDAPFGYVNSFTSHVNVGFFCGAMLEDPAGMLEGSGKRMRHVKLHPGHAIDAAALSDLIDAAYLDIKARLGADRSSRER